MGRPGTIRRSPRAASMSATPKRWPVTTWRPMGMTRLRDKDGSTPFCAAGLFGRGGRLIEDRPDLGPLFLEELGVLLGFRLLLALRRDLLHDAGLRVVKAGDARLAAIEHAHNHEPPSIVDHIAEHADGKREERVVQRFALQTSLVRPIVQAALVGLDAFGMGLRQVGQASA